MHGRRLEVPEAHLEKISKALNVVLRHRAADFNVKVRPDGFALLEEVLTSGPLYHHQIQDVVAAIDWSRDRTGNRRFGLAQTIDGTGIWIRAQRGHSLAVDVSAPPPRVAAHAQEEAFDATLRALRAAVAGRVHFGPPEGQEADKGPGPDCSPWAGRVGPRWAAPPPAAPEYPRLAPPPLPPHAQHLQAATGPAAHVDELALARALAPPPLPPHAHLQAATGPAAHEDELALERALAPPPLPPHVHLQAATGPTAHEDELAMEHTFAPPPLPPHVHLQAATGPTAHEDELALERARAPPPLPHHVHLQAATGPAAHEDEPVLARMMCWQRGPAARAGDGVPAAAAWPPPGASECGRVQCAFDGAQWEAEYGGQYLTLGLGEAVAVLPHPQSIDGWAFGECKGPTGRRGFFPLRYLERQGGSEAGPALPSNSSGEPGDAAVWL